MDNRTYFFGFSIRLVICVILIALLGFSIKSKAANNEALFGYNYSGKSSIPQTKLTAASSDAETIIAKILSVVGLKPNFEIRAANVPNAAAVILNKKRYILYNPKFIAQINYVSGNDWAGISIMAHEIGHHLNGHTLSSSGSQPMQELESDEFSGFVLCKLGASLADAQAAMNVAASQKSSHTHPAKKDRLVSIANGWNHANIQNGAVADVPKRNSISKPVLIETSKMETTALDERLIAFDVHFDEDSNTDYFITTKGNLVSVDDDSIYLIGHLSESNRRGYKLMLSDKNYNYLYIAPKGEIVNPDGKSVGFIAAHD